MGVVLEKLSPDEVCVYLKQEIPTIAEDILEKVVKHKIDGEVLLLLPSTIHV